MFKFFRKLRQILFFERKLGKYLLYAVGEIFLVVIGILIAVQINNWNESKKNRSLLQAYKTNLIENLAEDSLSINESVQGITTDLEAIEEFERRVSESPDPLETILQIARYEYTFIIFMKSDFENDTYKLLNSTGHLGLFPQEIIQELNELYNLQEEALFATNKTVDNYISSINHYSRKYPFTFKNNLIQNGTLAAEKVWGNISLSDHATEFNSLIIAKSDNYRLSLEDLPELRDKTNRLLEMLRE